MALGKWVATFAAGFATFKLASFLLGEREARASVREPEPAPSPAPAPTPAPSPPRSPGTNKPEGGGGGGGWFDAFHVPEVVIPEPVTATAPAASKAPPAKGKRVIYPPPNDESEYETPPEAAVLHPLGPIVPWKGRSVTMLPLYDPATQLFARLTYEGALAVAKRMGGMLLSTEEYDQIARDGYEIQPCPLVNSKEDSLKMGTLAYAKKHDKCVWAQLGGWKRDRPVANLGKQWIRGAAPGMALNYGWDKVPGPEVKYIQTLGHKHNAKHRDYSQVTMLIFP